MPASDLFVSTGDAEFRLLDTFIVVGKLVYRVEEVRMNEKAKTRLFVRNYATGLSQWVNLDDLPLSSMYACPHGYHQGMWICRGPARNRHQGITRHSLWGRYPDGTIQQGYYDTTGDILLKLLKQPVRAPRKKGKGIITRDVYVDPGNSRVLVRGQPVGLYQGGDFEPFTRLPSSYMEMLSNARIV